MNWGQKIGRKQTLRWSGDLREYPRYSIEEAATYLGIPVSTLKSWTRGYSRITRGGTRRRHPAIIQLADPDRSLLSFFNLAEAYVLRFARKQRVPLNRIRLAMEYIREQWKDDRPLLHKYLETRGKSVFIRELGLLVNASQHGQYGMEAILKRHLRGIRRGPDGLPEEIQPLERGLISINPAYSSGEPVVRGTGIMVSILVSRRMAGDDPGLIARDYGINRETIEQAIKAYKRPKAA